MDVRKRGSLMWELEVGVPSWRSPYPFKYNHCQWQGFDCSTEIKCIVNYGSLTPIVCYASKLQLCASIVYYILALTDCLSLCNLVLESQRFIYVTINGLTNQNIYLNGANILSVLFQAGFWPVSIFRSSLIIFHIIDYSSM